MNYLPQKTSLVAQTTGAILEQIQAGRWTSWLPGEHELCKQLHVSRTTVRVALDELSRMGMVRCRHGRRREIISRGPARIRTKSKRVVLLMPDPIQGMLFRTFLIYRLREHLAEEGYLLETHISRSPFRARSPQQLEKLAIMLQPAGWVLMSSSESLQKWFAARQLPCVIAGTRYENIDLSSVDLDYGAISRHAVGQFLSRGHRRIVLLNPHPGSAGEAATESNFHDAMMQSNHPDVEPLIIRHDGTVDNICVRLDTLMTRRKPPTAFLVARARHALTTLCYLLQKRFRVPTDAALISRDEEGYLGDVIPTIARYSSNPGTFAAKLSQTVIDMVRGNNRIIDYKVESQFIHGQTLG